MSHYTAALITHWHQHKQNQTLRVQIEKSQGYGFMCTTQISETFEEMGKEKGSRLVEYRKWMSYIITHIEKSLPLVFKELFILDDD